MRHFIYYPFPKTSSNGFNGVYIDALKNKYSSRSSANNSHDEKSGDHGQLGIVRYKGQSLEDIRDDDLLNIVCHGGRISASIIMSDKGANNEYETFERMDAGQLATQLESIPEKLPKTHRLIKMRSCYAAGILSTETSSGSPVRSGIQRQEHVRGEDAFFSKILAAALKNLDYYRVIVGGYPGTVRNFTIANRRYNRGKFDDRDGANHPKFNRLVVNVNGKKDSTFTVDAHEHIVWIDGNGNYVDRSKITEIKKASDLVDGEFSPASEFQKEKGLENIFIRTRKPEPK